MDCPRRKGKGSWGKPLIEQRLHKQLILHVIYA